MKILSFVMLGLGFVLVLASKFLKWEGTEMVQRQEIATLRARADESELRLGKVMAIFKVCSDFDFESAEEEVEGWRDTYQKAAWVARVKP